MRGQRFLEEFGPVLKKFVHHASTARCTNQQLRAQTPPNTQNHYITRMKTRETRDS